MKHEFPLKTFKVLRATGEEETLPYTKQPRMRTVQASLKYDVLDTVNLRDGRVMMVSDTGMLDGLPVNSEATALYHSVCKPGTVYAIHGDAALVWDEDFA